MAGPFPTELHDEDGEVLRRIGGERGVGPGRTETIEINSFL